MGMILKKKGKINKVKSHRMEKFVIKVRLLSIRKLKTLLKTLS